jgi:hypothetical protein
MPGFHVTLHHAFGRQEAARRIEMLMDQFQHRYGNRFDRIESVWEGHDLIFRMVRGSTVVSGRVVIGTRTLTLEVTVPWTLSPFASRLRQQFEQEGRRLLNG